MQRFTIYLLLQDALRVSDGVSVHHQELKTAHTASGLSERYCYLPLASLARLAVGSSIGLTNT